MFTARDPNFASAAPSVKIPTLSSPGGDPAVAKAAACSSSTSMRRRFSNPRLLGEFGGPAGASRFSETGVCVHECGTETSALVESLPWHEWGQRSRGGSEGKSYNELCQLEEPTGQSGGALQSSSSPTLPVPSSIVGSDALTINFPADGLLLQQEGFVEHLVQHVRASCTGKSLECSAGILDWEKGAVSGAANRQNLSSSPPGHHPLGAEFSDATRNPSNDAPKRSTALSRLRDPSLMSDFSGETRFLRSTATGAARAKADTSLGRRAPESVSSIHQRSSTTSPDPRPPSTDLYATGGALRSSLQHSRCVGVSRARRSESAERPDYCDGYVSSAAHVQEEEEEDGVCTFQRLATAVSTETPRATGLRSNSISHSESAHRENARLQWNPRPIEEARPAWNQRQPPRKQRPVVSAPGSKPPSSARRCASRSPDAFAGANGLRGVKSEEKGGSGASRRSTEHAMRRSLSLPSKLSQERMTASRCAAGQLPRATVDSPSSPPSARVLFHGHDTHDTVPATLPLEQERRADLQSQCEAALARATRAERQCDLLSHALDQLLIDHRADKAAWEARHSALEQRLASVVEWITGVDAEAGLSAAPQVSAKTATFEITPLDTATPHVPKRETEVDDALSSVATVATKITAWEGNVDFSNIHNNGGANSTGSSPISCAAGATPSPARRNTANSDSGCASTCEVRLPPSPPLVLRMHTTST